MRWISQKCSARKCLIDIKDHQRVVGNCGVITCGGSHCSGTHFLHLPGTVLGCRGCGASWAPWTDRWPYSCESQAGSGVEAEAHWDLEAGERSGGRQRSTDYSTQIHNLCIFHQYRLVFKIGFIFKLGLQKQKVPAWRVMLSIFGKCVRAVVGSILQQNTFESKNWLNGAGKYTSILCVQSQTMSHLDEVLDKYFHHNVLELDVHHGGHSFLLWPHQCGPKDDTQVGYRHQVELALCGNSAGWGHGRYSSVRYWYCTLIMQILTTSANHVVTVCSNNNWHPQIH